MCKCLGGNGHRALLPHCLPAALLLLHARLPTAPLSPALPALRLPPRPAPPHSCFSPAPAPCRWWAPWL